MADLPKPATALLEIPIRYEWFLNTLRELDEFVQSSSEGEIEIGGIKVSSGDFNCSRKSRMSWAKFYKNAMYDISCKAYPQT